MMGFGVKKQELTALQKAEADLRLARGNLAWHLAEAERCVSKVQEAEIRARALLEAEAGDMRAAMVEVAS